MTFHLVEPQIILLFKDIIKRHASLQESSWIDQKLEKFKNDFQLHAFHLAFSSVGRYIEGRSLKLSENELQLAHEIREGFHIQSWSLVQLVRAYFLLILAEMKKETFVQNLKILAETADVEEQVVIFKTLPLFPYPERLNKRATEGIRTNVSVVFDAVALDNPYPSDFLNQDQWNQMILKAVFMQRPLYRIYGVEKRNNPELAIMLTDFAHERWAAKRRVTPEIWRFVGPYLSVDHLSDFQRAKESSTIETEAFLLAAKESKLLKAHKLLEEHPKIKREIEDEQITWRTIGIKNQEENQEL